MRRFLALVFGLGLLGDIAAILLAPRLIRYWYMPPVAGTSTMVTNPLEVLNYGMSELIKYQIMGTIGGMLLGALIAFMLWRRGRRSAAAATVPAAVPATPAKV